VFAGAGLTGSMDCMTRYDSIGHGYRRTRRDDPRIAARVHRALSDARTVVNVGAGTGSYEPRDRHVVAIEPSDVMASERPRDVAPAIQASAGALPLRDNSVDAAMAVLTIHHWDDEQERGVRELRRVARGPVVILRTTRASAGGCGSWQSSCTRCAISISRSFLRRSASRNGSAARPKLRRF
jgi:SAM-dependent methyltransferase